MPEVRGENRRKALRTLRTHWITLLSTASINNLKEDEFNKQQINHCYEDDIMRMKPGCEAIAKKVVPVLRARVAQFLANDYHMQQYEISKKLGVTQAAISFYLGKERGSNVSLLKKFPEIDVSAKKIAKALRKDAKEDEVSELLCELCRKMKRRRAFKELVK
jgi:predicted transcriptional regulator